MKNSHSNSNIIVIGNSTIIVCYTRGRLALFIDKAVEPSMSTHRISTTIMLTMLSMPCILVNKSDRRRVVREPKEAPSQTAR